MGRTLCMLVLVPLVAAAAPQELLENNGFESGLLDPWTTSAWTVSTDSPHSGTYCAFVEGNNWIKQEFTPTGVTEIVSITLWYRQPEAQIFAFDLYYGPTEYDEELVYVAGTDWIQYDFTYFLRPSGDLQAVRVWGYYGGGPDPDHCFLDDVSVIFDDAVSLEQSTFGGIKALLGS
ncbi:MAG: hypothetical protein AVO35_06310 [Candidatus Aegiribacteria sp. MLS_C]|nr:MAG: hypothetical protein AVO35_06310 [Candidatus Aegiribacteria sp. MLS_C]